MPSPAASVEARAVMMETWAQPPLLATAFAGPAIAIPAATRPAVAVTTAPTMLRLRTRDFVDGCMGDSLLVGAERPLPPPGGIPLAGGCSGRPAVHTVVRAGLQHAYLRMSCIRGKPPEAHRHNCRPSIGAVPGLLSVESTSTDSYHYLPGSPVQDWWRR